MKTFVFIAGAYSGSNPAYWEIDQNIAEAGKWASRLAINQIPFFCPHLNSRHFEVITPNVPPSFWLMMDLVLLELASAVLALPNVYLSQGAQNEVAVAEEKNIPVFYADDEDFTRLVDFWDKIA